MNEDAVLRTADPRFQSVATSLVDRLESGRDLSVWALLDSSSGSQFMVLLIDDGSGGPRILFGLHQPGRRSLPDRVDMHDLGLDSVVHALTVAYRRAVQRGDEPPGCDLALASLGTPSQAGADEDIDRAPTRRIPLSGASPQVS